MTRRSKGKRSALRMRQFKRKVDKISDFIHYHFKTVSLSNDMIEMLLGYNSQISVKQCAIFVYNEFTRR